MLNKDEIKKRLKGVDPQLCVDFAARCSLRVLPLLVADKEKEVFWYWNKTDQSRYVLGVLICQQISINFSAFGRKVYADAAARAARAAASADAARPDAAAARAIRSAKLANINLEIEIDRDLNNITNKKRSFFSNSTSKIISPIDFIYTPLWSDSPPENWNTLYSRFNESLLALDEGFEIWVNWYQDRLDSKPLDKDQEEKWLNIPAEITDQGAKASNAYRATLISTRQKDSLKPLNLVRAIFIGNGAAGKTSLIRKLHNEPVVEGKEEKTPGIEIRQWDVPGSAIKARFWDFGGQVMSHSTHQFFLRERCLYILVVDAGSEREVREKQTANNQAEYWLEHVKAFGYGARVMLVRNKSDLTPVNLDMNALVEKFGEMIVGFFRFPVPV